jgi:sec-independent protein translocase protein TatA
MTLRPTILAFFQSLGWPELLVIGIVALLIFGRRLPEVGRSLGRSFVEFKKGLKDTGDELKDIRSDVNQSIDDRQSDSKQDARSFNDPSHNGAENSGPSHRSS